MKKYKVTAILPLLVIAIQNYTAIAAQEQNWELVSKEEGITVETKDVAGSELIMVRGNATLKEPLEKVFNLMIDHPTRKLWVDRLEHIERIHEIDGKLDAITHYIVDMPWPVSDRDFVVRTKIKFSPENNTITSNTGSVFNYLPPQEGLIRAISHNSTVILTKVDSEHTKITIKARVEPKGSLPIFIVNYFQKRWARSTLVSLKEALNEIPMIKDVEFQRLTLGSKAPVKHRRL